MNSPTSLNSDDRCQRLAFLEQRWQTPGITPTAALYDAIELGLQSTASDPGDVASDRLMELATSRGLDSNQTDLLGEAEHLSSLAGFIVWLLRPGDPWKRPEPVTLPNGTIWTPGAFLDASETHLRRIVLCGRWDAYRMTEEEHDWRTLEAAVYGVPMDLVVIVLGQQRDGRRHGPLCKGWTHPVAKTLRFRKRDGSGFDANWTPIFREQSNFSREDWLDAMVEDGLLSETVLIHRVEVPEPIHHLVKQATSKLERIFLTQIPEPQLSRCFDRFAPCPFRSCCPRGFEPSEELGFVKITSYP